MAMSVEDDRQQLTPHVQNQQSSSEQAEGGMPSFQSQPWAFPAGCGWQSCVTSLFPQV